MVGTSRLMVARSAAMPRSQAEGSNLLCRMTVPPRIRVGRMSIPAAWEIGATAR